MRVTPKISGQASGHEKKRGRPASPFRNWATREDMMPRDREFTLRAEFPDLGIGRQESRAVRVRPRGHHALAVPLAGAADVGAQSRLMVERAENDVAERSADAKVLHRFDQFLAVEAPRLGDRRGGAHHGRVADDRSARG